MKKLFRHIIFRVSSDIKFGLGHINRCLELRKHLPNKCTWLLDDKVPKNIIKFINSNDKIILEKNNFSTEFLIYEMEKNINAISIIDGYNFNFKNLEKFNERIIFFSDNMIEPKARLIINPQPGAIAKKGVLAGVKYLIIDQSFLQNKKVEKSFNVNFPLPVLISFGGVDSLNLTNKVAKSILNDKFLKDILLPTCLIPSGFKHLDTIIKLKKSHKSLTILRGIKNIGQLTGQFKIAIGGAGISQSERILAGMATLLIPQNKHHEVIVKEWENIGCAIACSTDQKKIITSLKKMISRNMFLVKSIIKNGHSMVDGNGVKRVAEEILKI